MGERIESDPAIESETEAIEPQLLETGAELQEEFRELQAEMLEAATKLVFEAATCDCRDRDKCGVFQAARNLSKVLKELQDVGKKGKLQTTRKGFRKRKG